MKFVIIIYTTNKLTVVEITSMVEMEDIRGVRLRKFKLRKIVLGVRMHFHHKNSKRCQKKVNLAFMTQRIINISSLFLLR